MYVAHTKTFKFKQQEYDYRELADTIHNEAATVHRKKTWENESVAKFRRNGSTSNHGEK